MNLYYNRIAHRFALSLANIVVDQYLPSESDCGYQPFSANMPKEMMLNSDTFLEALDFNIPAEISMKDAAGFFDQVEEAAAEEGDELGRDVYMLLRRVMFGSMSDLKTVYARGPGAVQVPFFLFGRMADGTLAGLQSTAIET